MTLLAVRVDFSNAISSRVVFLTLEEFEKLTKAYAENGARYVLVYRRYLGPEPEFSASTGAKPLPPGVSAERPGFMDRIGDYFSGNGDAPAPVSGAASRRGRPRGGGRARGRGGAKAVSKMSVTEIDDLINARGDSLSPADLKAIEARLAKLGK